MATNIGQLFIDLSTNSAAFSSDMADASAAVKSSTAKMNRVLGKLDKGFVAAGKRVKNFGKSLVSLRGIMSIGALTYLGKGFLDAASEVEEMESKFNAVFGKTAKEVDVWARGFAESIGRSRYEIKTIAADLEATLGPAFTEVTGLSNIMSMALTELALDLSSFHNMTDSDALEKLRAAMNGSSETVIQFGADIKESALAIELNRLGIKKVGDSYTEAQKKLARFNIIIRATRNAQGDAAATQDSYANQMRTLSSRMLELSVSAGTALMPAISSIVQILIKGAPTLEKWVKQFGRWTGTLDETDADKLEIVNRELAKAQRAFANLNRELDANNDIMPHDGFAEVYFETEKWVGLLLRLQKHYQDKIAKSEADATEAARAEAKKRYDAQVEAAEAYARRLLGISESADIEAAKRAKEWAKRIAASVKMPSELVAEGVSIWESLRTPAEKYADEVERINELKRQGVDFGGNYLTILERLEKKYEDTERKASVFGQTLENAFQNAIFSAGSFMDILTAVGKKMLSVVLFGMEGGGGLFGGMINSFGKGLDNIFGNIMPAASGTSSSVGGAFKVGEHGTGEVIMTGAATKVVPLKNAGGGMGGGAIIQVIDQRGADSPPVEVQRGPSDDGRQLYRLFIKAAADDVSGRGDLFNAISRRFDLTAAGR